MYNCRRTMRIRSKKYSTLAVMNSEHFRELSFNFPLIEDRFREYTYNYHDETKLLIQKIVTMIPYFRALSQF